MKIFFLGESGNKDGNWLLLESDAKRVKENVVSKFLLKEANIE
jgi:hypothetical protein